MDRKRPFSYNDEGDSLGSRRRLAQSFLRLCIHDRSLGAIIGKSGLIIDQIKVLLDVCE